MNADQKGTSGNEADDNGEADEEWARMSKALSLCIAYAANVGGTASMTGSTPNLVLKGQLEMYFCVLLIHK